MDDLIRFDPALADKLSRNIENKVKSIKRTLNKIEGLVAECAKKNWEGPSRKEYVNLYTASSAEVNEFLGNWLRDIAKFMDDAKEAKRLQEDAGAEMIKSARNTIASPQ